MGQLMIVVLAAALAGCGGAGKRPLGASCDDSSECASALCLDGACVEPFADEDLDGLPNLLEAELGSSARDADTDGDGVRDPDELAPGQALVDSDGDGEADIIESAVADADGDCITDQFDARNTTPDADPSPMLSQVCQRQGICAEQEGRLRVTCAAGGGARCEYDGVEGFADPEIACDGRDENCDGQVDEAFPRGCAISARTWLAPATSGRNTQSQRYRATLVYGPAPVRETGSARHRAILGRLPDPPRPGVVDGDPQEPRGGQ